MKNKNTINIKSCPICGIKPIVDINIDGFDGVRCPKCKIYVEGYSKESAIKIWNKSDCCDGYDFI